MANRSHPEHKTCATCGRTIEWRRKWAEAARRVATAGDDGADDADRHGNDEGWRDLMEPARAAARRLVADGQVVIKQRGWMVDPSTAKGPIRLARGPAWDDGPTRYRRGHE